MSDSVDTLLTADLAALAAHNRRELTTLTESLRPSGAYRDDRLGAEARRDELAKLRRNELAGMPLSLAHVFVHRVARAAAGGAAMLGVLGFLVLLAAPGAFKMMNWYAIEMRLSTAAAVLAAGTLAVYVIATWIGEHLFARRMRNAIASSGDVHNDLDRLAEGPLEVAHRLVRRADGWAVGFTIAGLVSATALLGIVVFFDEMIRHYPMRFDFGALAFGGALAHNAVMIVFALCLAGIPAWLVARACDREHRLLMRSHWLKLAHWTAPLAGMVIGFVTLRHAIAAARASRLPPHDLRFVLALGGLAAIFLVATWIVLWWRKRESRRIDG